MDGRVRITWGYLALAGLAGLADRGRVNPDLPDVQPKLWRPTADRGRKQQH